jgi:hypothetical protein
MTLGPVITFGHGRRHLRNIGLTADEVEAAIAQNIDENPILETAELEVRRIVVEGVLLEYHAWRRDRCGERWHVLSSEVAVARKLAPDEIAIIDRLLEVDFPGRDEVAAQIEHSRVSSADYDDNYGSLDFEVRQAPRAPVTSRVPVSGRTFDVDGVPIEVLLHVVDGIIEELEIVKADGSPIERRPEASRLEVFAADLAQ